MTLIAENQQRIDVAFKMIQVLLLCLLSTVAVVTILPHLIELNEKSEQLKSAQPLKDIFLIFSFLFVLIGFASKYLLSRQPSQQDVNDYIAACIKSFHISNLVSFVIFESVALLGFVNYVLSGDSGSTIIFSSISIISMLIAWPKKNHLQNMIETQT